MHLCFISAKLDLSMCSKEFTTALALNHLLAYIEWVWKVLACSILIPHIIKKLHVIRSFSGYRVSLALYILVNLIRMMGIDYYSFVRACFQIMLPHHLPMTKKKYRSSDQATNMNKAFQIWKQSWCKKFIVCKNRAALLFFWYKH